MEIMHFTFGCIFDDEGYVTSTQIRRSWNPAPRDDSRNRRQGGSFGIPWTGKTSSPAPASWPGLFWRTMFMDFESRVWDCAGEIARKLGVCTSAIAKAIRKKEGEDQRC